MLKPVLTTIMAVSLAFASPAFADSRLILKTDGSALSLPKLAPGVSGDGLDLVGRTGTSHIQEGCVYGEDDITRCNDCEVDWDMNPPDKICIVAAICWDDDKQIDCPP